MGKYLSLWQWQEVHRLESKHTPPPGWDTGKQYQCAHCTFTTDDVGDFWQHAEREHLTAKGKAQKVTDSP